MPSTLAHGASGHDDLLIEEFGFGGRSAVENSRACGGACGSLCAVPGPTPSGYVPAAAAVHSAA